MNLLRIVDANMNRASEGLRVLEDVARFVYEDQICSEELRLLRHKVRKVYYHPDLLSYRDAENDIGINISRNSDLDRKERFNDVIGANFKRVQEAIRSIEEALKVIGEYNFSKVYESLRFECYTLEKKMNRLKFFLTTDVYGITGERFANGRTNIEVASKMMDAGIKVIQYREKDKDKNEKYLDCVRIREMTRENGVFFIVNDDVDIALSVKADGIHIGQNDMPVNSVRKLVGNMIIGVSTHNPEQAKEAVKNGADYIGVGPIFSTQTKKNIEQSKGLEYLKWVSEHIKIPHVTIGGIKESNIKQVKEHGGTCFAMISEIIGSDDIGIKVEKIRKKLNGERD